VNPGKSQQILHKQGLIGLGGTGDRGRAGAEKEAVMQCIFQFAKIASRFVLFRGR
jgi:hypothetical protein